MRSTNYINFAIRQNKSIERSIVFDALKRLCTVIGREDFVYVGLGSVWFVDFELAHRVLAIETMISIESEEVTFKRAQFNRPYRTVDVIKGSSYDVIPNMLATRSDLENRPWIVWLDYDEILDETKIDELRLLIELLPSDSILLTTFSASPGRYDKAAQLQQRFESLLGDAFPFERFRKPRDFKNEVKLMVALSSAVNNLMQSQFIRVARKGRFIPAFSLQYQDGTPMATAGGVLASQELAEPLDSEVSNSWRALSETPIVTPPLTHLEVTALRALLPSDRPVSRQDIQDVGFDLLEEQIESFVEHYLRYPTFVETVR